MVRVYRKDVPLMTVRTGCSTCAHADRSKSGWTCPFIKKAGRATKGYCPAINITTEELANRKWGCHGECYEHDGSTATCQGCGSGHTNNDTHCTKCQQALAQFHRSRVDRLMRNGTIR